MANQAITYFTGQLYKKLPMPSTLEPTFKVSFFTLPSALSLGVLYAFLGEVVCVCTAFVFIRREN